MLRNYIKIAWRNVMRHKAYSMINVLGLSLGICACIVIYLITSYEFSFDNFHPDRKRIYRITGEALKSSGEQEFLNSPFKDVAGIENDIPGFEAKAGVIYYNAKVNIPGDESKKEFHDNDEVVVTWPQYFNIFKYEWLAGNATTALNEPYKVVLTEKKARKYFGNKPLEDIIGSSVIYNDSLQVSVSGIVKDWNANTDFTFTDFISISTASNAFLKKDIPATDWSSLNPHMSMAFVKLNKQTTEAQVNAQLDAYIRKHVKPNEFVRALNLKLQPLSAIHFTNDYYRADDGDNFRKSHLPTLYALMGIALFILIIAAVNFINLSTAQSIQRSKEIGVRKVLGSGRKSLVLQFLTETMVLTFIAILISLLLVTPVLSLFKSFIPQGVTFNPFKPGTLIFLLIVLVATSLLAGFYPAKVLSSYVPALSLKGVTSNAGSSGVNLRKGLIVFQFSISLVFIISAIVISNQINFMRTKDKGFKTDAIITINNWGDQPGKMKVLAAKIKQVRGVDKVILQGTAPMGSGEQGGLLTYKGKEELKLEVALKLGNEDFIPFYNIKLLAGRNMLHSDSLQELVINETLSKALGFSKPSEAIGKFLYGGDKPLAIVGVVADFHQTSFHKAIQPAVIQHVPEWETNLAVSLATKNKHITDTKTIISQIEEQWKQLYPDRGLDYSFLDDSITWLFEKDQQTAWLMNAAMIVTIFISCMGLFGLAMFTAERRTKEIGIRKVLGASVANVAAMLSKDFVLLVVIALLIASPIAWYFMNQWLQDFAYRTSIGLQVFVLAGVAAIAIALVTVSFQAIKAAIANPVKSLRTE